MVMKMKAVFSLLLFISTTVNAAGKVKVSCIGNSITEGNMGGKYPVYLSSLLGEGYQVENDGVSGTTLLKNGDKPYWTKGKLNQVFAFKPDIITIKLGTNDTKPQNWDYHKNEFERDLIALIDTLNTLSTQPEIFLVLPAPAFSNVYGIRDSILNPIVTIIKDVAADRTLPVIDVNTPLLNFRNYFKDGVHPNEAGSDTIAHLIYRSIIASTNSYSENRSRNISIAHRHNRLNTAISLTGDQLHNKAFDLSGRFINSGNKVSEILKCRAGVYIIKD